MTQTTTITTAALIALLEAVRANGSIIIGTFLGIAVGGTIQWYRTRTTNTPIATQNIPINGTPTDITPILTHTTDAPTTRHRPTPINTSGLQTPSSGSQKATPDDQMITEEGIRHLGEFAPGMDTPEAWQLMQAHREEAAVNGGPATAALAGPFGGGAARAGPSMRRSQGGPGYRGEEWVLEEDEEVDDFFDDKENDNAGPLDRQDEDENGQDGGSMRGVY